MRNFNYRIYAAAAVMLGAAVSFASCGDLSSVPPAAVQTAQSETSGYSEISASGEQTETAVPVAASSPAGTALTLGTADDTVSDNGDDISDIDQSPEAECTETAKRLCGQMMLGKFDECAELFSDELKAQVSAVYLGQLYDELAQASGNITGDITAETSAENERISVLCTVGYTVRDILVTFVFDTDGKIGGIWLSGAAAEILPESTGTYTEEPVKIGGYGLDGMLTLPENAEKPPVVIMVQGSGQSDMDETVNGLAPFKDIAHGLAEKGIASIRFNKRYYQHPEISAEETLTIYTEFMDDAGAAILLAENDDRVGDIYILGHSLGAMAAPRIAADNSSVRGIISLAGSPRSLEDIIFDQTQYSLAKQGHPAELIETQMTSLAEEIGRIKQLTPDDTGTYFGINAEYWYSMNGLKQAEAALSLDIPMLFLQGSDDEQIFADIDFAQWKKLLADSPYSVFKEYSGLGHFFDADGKVSQAVIDDIAEFVSAG